MKPYHNVIEPLFNSEEYQEYMESIPVLKRISIGIFSWAGDGVPNDAHFWGKQDFLTDPQFQGESEINYFRKTNTDLVTFLQTEGWLCLVRIRKILRMLNIIENYEGKIETLSQAAGFPVDSWGGVFEKMHPTKSCHCAPCSALREVKKQLVKKNISGQEISQSVVHHIRRCVYRVLISGVDRIFETFCSRRFSIVWFILSEEFDEHYRDTEFEKLCSLIMNDMVAIEPLTSLANFGKTLSELYEGATDLARAILHKFAVILGSQKMFYTSSMNFIMFYIDSFNMLIRMLRWLESKFKVFNQRANRISDESLNDRLDFKCIILHAMNELVYGVPDVMNRREAALKVIAAYQKLKKSYFGPTVDNLERYLDYIDTTLLVATTVFQMAKLPCKCPAFKVPKKNVIDAALYINPYRDDQFDAPQVFHCYWQDRYVIERSQTPWKILYNNKAKILLRLTVENPMDKNKKLAINVFLAEESCSVEERIKDQYFALYESRLERLVDFFDVLKQEVIEYYANTNQTFDRSTKVRTRSSCKGKANPLSTGAMCRRLNSNANVTKISVPVKLKRPDRRSRYARDNRMAILSSLMQKHRKSKKPSTTESFEELLTFAVKTGVEGSGMLPELTGDTKDVYVSITSVDKARRAKADQEFSLHELMSFIIFWYARHGCVTEFEGHTLHKTTFGCSKSSFKDNFPLLYKAAEELDAAVGEGLLSDNDLAILEKGLSNSMTDEEIKRCKKGLETTLLMKREFNELVQSKRAFAKLSSSGFCVTLSGPAEASSVLCAEADGKKMDPGQRKAKPSAKVNEARNRMKKTLEARQEVVTTKSSTVNSQNGQQPAKSQPAKSQSADDMKPPPAAPPKVQQEVVNEKPAAPPPAPVHLDVDELVQLIEGTTISSNNASNQNQASSESNPKKAAKKARQKEKKEQEKQRMADEKAKEEEQRKAEELKRIEEEKRKEELERKKREQEEQRRKDDILKKQKELAELKKEEQRKKRQELERKMLEEKKLKKDAKKQRREQRKKDMESLENENRVDTKPATPNESFCKTDFVNGNGKRTPTVDVVSEKEYGRLKHEKEQRKREEEEARRLAELKAQERSQANKKNKKKKKKAKQNEINNDSTIDEPVNNAQTVHILNAAEVKPVLVGQPLLEILNSSMNTDTPNPDSKLVTIKKHVDSSVTISMRGKEVYPTSPDGTICTEAPLPLQPNTFAKQEIVRPTHLGIVPNPNPVNYSHMGLAHQVRNMYHPQAPIGNSSFVKEAASIPEIDLSQLKLPPGITITKVPQHMSVPRGDEMNGVQTSDFLKHVSKQPIISDHHQPISMGGMDHRHNSSIMVVDSRSSSLESPVIGIRPAEMAYGANGTRPSSETSVASDRPSSGLDSLCNNGSSPFVNRTGYHSTEILNKRVPIAISSPYAAASRNETPSPGWQNDVHPNIIGMPAMPQNSSVPDRQGFWSPSPSSPVAFPPANSVNDNYIRVQDSHFIRPRPTQRGVAAYPQMPNRISPSQGIRPDSVYARKTPATDFKPIGGSGVATRMSPQYNQGITINGTTAPPNIRPIGYKPIIEPTQSKPPPIDQWTPWNINADRATPDLHPVALSSEYIPKNFSLDNLLSDDINGPWESSVPVEKPASRTVNPYGPIGSNINRRSSGANGLNGKISESGPEDTWAYNRNY